MHAVDKGNGKEGEEIQTVKVCGKRNNMFN
jgi:hypothetical protein